MARTIQQRNLPLFSQLWRSNSPYKRLQTRLPPLEPELLNWSAGRLTATIYQPEHPCLIKPWLQIPPQWIAFGQISAVPRKSRSDHRYQLFVQGIKSAH
jgi:hypothetical protein